MSKYQCRTSEEFSHYQFTDSLWEITVVRAIEECGGFGNFLALSFDEDKTVEEFLQDKFSHDLVDPFGKTATEADFPDADDPELDLWRVLFNMCIAYRKWADEVTACMDV